MPRKKLVRVQSPMIDIPAAPAPDASESLRSAAAPRPSAPELAAPSASNLEEHPAA